MTAHQELLKRQQTAAGIAYDRMIRSLIGWDPAQKLRVEDVKQIAEMARTYAFDAIKEVEKGS